MLLYTAKEVLFMEKNWNELFLYAKDKINSRDISSFVKVANICCVIETDNNFYSGIDIVSLNKSYTALEVAIINMINNNEYVVKRMVIFNELEEIINPSLKDIEFLLSINKENINTEIMTVLKQVVKLKDFLPDWWGTYHIEK